MSLHPDQLLPILLAAGLLACGGSPQLTADQARRLVPLEGAANFRDLGGYRTVGGRSVRWGLLYRSDDLSELTPEDVKTVGSLGIRLVCDFRSDQEREEAPDRLPRDPAPEVLHLGIGGDALLPGGLRERLRSCDLEGLELDRLLIDGNRAFATEFSAQYAAMFERISSADNLPALVHCTAGKDRAGFASASILRALGVPEETVYEDYLLTNLYTEQKVERQLLLIRIFSLFRTDPELLRPLFEARRAYLEAAFTTIESEYGSFDVYLREALGVDDDERAALQALLLE